MKKKNHTPRTITTTTTYLCFLHLFPLAAAQAQPDDLSDPNNPNNNFNQFSSSIAILITVLVAALFLLGFFSIYIRNCADSPSITLQPHIFTSSRSRRAARGLHPAVIETFPILEYSEVKIHKIGKEALECAVCLCEFEDTETLRLIPKCHHVFHPDCIDKWLSSHATCPVCRANLVPQPGESVHDFPIPIPNLQSRSPDVEAQNDAVIEAASTEQQNAGVDRVFSVSEPEVVPPNKTLNRNPTRGSRSNRPSRFTRSHSTGHSLLVQPGENTERFTLRLPWEVRNRIINRQLQRASSSIVLRRESSSRQGNRTDGEGSSRGKRISRLLDLSFKSDRWVFTMAPPFLVRSPKVGNNSSGEGATSSVPVMPPLAVDSSRPPL